MGKPNDLHGRVSENKTNTTVQNHNARPCIIKEHDVSCYQNAYKRETPSFTHNTKTNNALKPCPCEERNTEVLHPSRLARSFFLFFSLLVLFFRIVFLFFSYLP